ncbi:MAG: hypothetical protein ACM3Y9_00355 [Ignavibacteria bacterium]
MQEARSDKKTAAAVNRGLAAALLANVKAGVKLMTEEGVPADVMARVVLAPLRRRASDWRR